MNGVVVNALRGILAIALTGSVVVQVVVIFFMGSDSPGGRTPSDLALQVIAFLGVVALQVIGVCVWKLLTLVRRGGVFSPVAFRHVDLIIGSITAGSLLVFAIAVVGSYVNRTTRATRWHPGWSVSSAAPRW
ncbi:DUF2975 domain-containing protein [Mariniluteicoccus flavus]